MRSGSCRATRFAPFVELRLLDWAHAIARRWLYEVADEIRIAALMQEGDPKVAGLAAKINREEAYHRMHAEMWRELLAETPQFRAAVEELWNEMTMVRRSAPAGSQW